jgi:hypothetical protein
MEKEEKRTMKTTFVAEPHINTVKVRLSLSAVCCLLSAVSYLLSAVRCLLSAVCCLLFAGCCLPSLSLLLVNPARSSM